MLTCHISVVPVPLLNKQSGNIKWYRYHVVQKGQLRAELPVLACSILHEHWTSKIGSPKFAFKTHDDGQPPAKTSNPPLYNWQPNLAPPAPRLLISFIRFLIPISVAASRLIGFIRFLFPIRGAGQ